MNVDTIFFFILAFTSVGTALIMITRRNPIVSALYLIVNFFCLAVLYLVLQAQFIAIVQILVYAGAIMVLFLFVIMLLSLKDERRLADKASIKKIVAITLSVVVLLEILIALRLPSGVGPTELAANARTLGTVESIGKVLFHQYIVPFEVTSILLLAAMVGVLVLAKKKLD